jgi:GNAT superfamily N-acetyltransferase
MMIDFFGTTPGLLSLAGAALILILVSVLRRLAARPRARRAGLAAGPAGPPRWLVAAIAAWAAEQAGGGPAGGTAAPGCDAPCGPDPWLAAAGPARRNVGVTK